MNSAFLIDLITRPQGAPKAPLPTCASTRLQIWTVGLLCALVLTPLYTWTTAPSMGLCHDTGELTACCVIQGVPHSPGYPLFVALGWLVCQLPGGAEPAYLLNLLCAIEVGLAMGFLGAALALASRPWPALLATLLTGTCTAVWRQAVQTEVFSLHLLLLCALLWLAMLWELAEDDKRREIVLVTSFILGCCLAHQHIIALAGPPLLAYGVLAKGKGRAWGFGWMNLPVFLAAWLLPYALQMYCAQQSPALNWENPSTVSGVIDHFLRKTYGTGLLNAAALKYDARAGDTQVTSFMLNLVRSYYPFPSFVFLGICLDRMFVAKFSPRVWLYVCLAIVYGPFFASLGNQPTEEFYADMMERFYSSSMVGVAGMLAFGIEWTFYQMAPTALKYLPGLLLLVPYNGFSNYPRCTQRDNYLGVDLLRAEFKQLPPRSALLVNGDMPAGAVDYLRYALGERKDVIVILPGLASASWFRQRLPVAVDLAATRGLDEGSGLSSEDATRKMVKHLQSRGYQIYCNQIPQGLEGEYTRFGLLLRYRGQTPAWTKEQGQAECQRVFKILESCPWRGPQKVDRYQNFWIRFCLNEWIVGYRSLAEGLAEVDKEGACKCMDKVIALEPVPRIESYLNRAGLYLERKMYQDAIRDYEVCLQLMPECQLALEGIVPAYLATGDTEVAARYQKRLQRLSSATP